MKTKIKEFCTDMLDIAYDVCDFFVDDVLGFIIYCVDGKAA